MMRRTMLAPMRPRPIMPSCISGLLTSVSVATDECVRGTVVLQVRISGRRQLVGDLLGEYLAQLDAPLIEGVDRPDRALGEHAVLVQGDQGAQRVRREP